MAMSFAEADLTSGSRPPLLPEDHGDYIRGACNTRNNTSAIAILAGSLEPQSFTADVLNRPEGAAASRGSVHWCDRAAPHHPLRSHAPSQLAPYARQGVCAQAQGQEAPPSTSAVPSRLLERNSPPPIITSEPVPVPSPVEVESPMSESSPQTSAGIDLGYPRNLEEIFELGGEVGKGGNGTVREATEKSTGTVFACKIIPKVLPDTATQRKRDNHINSLGREIGVMHRLKGCLNLVELEGAYEDADFVYIVQENCLGGMLSIDFGLAVPFDPEHLPLTDLGLEGTPWYLAPEVLSSQVFPASDIWQVGVMAYQLLTGRLPFDDRRRPKTPDLNQIWRSILIDEVDVNSKYFLGISKEGRDFVARCLDRDPKKRPTAKEALMHPWLKGTSSERSTELDKSIVQRIQRYAQSSVFKRIVLQSITEDMLSYPSEADNSVAMCRVDQYGNHVVDQSLCMEILLDKFKGLDEESGLSVEDFQQSLKDIGFVMEPNESLRLYSAMMSDGGVAKGSFLASQMDWKALQNEREEDWNKLVEKIFKKLDSNQDGWITQSDILQALGSRVPASEMQGAVEHALEEAGVSLNSDVMDMEDFHNMLYIGSTDCLDMYDGRFDMMSSLDMLSNPISSVGSLDAGQPLPASTTGTSHQPRPWAAKHAAKALAKFEAAHTPGAKSQAKPVASFNFGTETQRREKVKELEATMQAKPVANFNFGTQRREKVKEVEVQAKPGANINDGTGLQKR
eukprot:gene20161-26897_t